MAVHSRYPRSGPYLTPDSAVFIQAASTLPSETLLPNRQSPFPLLHRFHTWVHYRLWPPNCLPLCFILHKHTPKWITGISNFISASASQRIQTITEIINIFKLHEFKTVIQINFKVMKKEEGGWLDFSCTWSKYGLMATVIKHSGQYYSIGMFCLFFSFFIFETRSCYVAQASLKHEILLPRPLNC